ncbi:MAG TPA: AAA family ATPase, partial [Candidatus Polarisedimenticolia bacterium]|nr:AAA family ATPase [Candidatus Polarisedimenticolia bacterium]
MTDWVGRDISHYRVTRELGQGGMGVVYLAEDLNLGRPVVLKVIRRELAADPRVEERFRREARACASVVHPNITTLFEVNRHDDLWYMCMEYVEGRTLRTLLSESGTLPVSDAVRIAAAAADALGAAHARGIVHRDIKPENIMISEAGQVKVLDFGLAAFTSRSLQRLDVSALQTGAEQLTIEGVAIGTLHYMSPEQARGAAVTPASDVFSLGAVLYETLAGLPPFRGDNSLAVMHSIAYDEPPPLASRRADVSLELEQVVRRALRKRPDERYESGASLRHDLLRLAGEEAALSPESGSSVGAPVLLSSEFLHDAVTDQAPRHFDARLVGREKELQALTARLDRALHGEGSLVLVSGEAGIGKTRLVSELARRSEMRGARYVLGRCVFREGGLPYHPFVEAADRLIAGLGLEDSSRFEAYVRERIPALAGRLPILKSFLQLAGQESTALIADKEHLLDAISALFLGFARERPMLLHIDDLHWADEATVDLLLYLARSCRDSQGLIVGTYRPEEVTGSAGAHPLGRLLDRMSTGDVYEEIRLGRLGPADTAAIVSSTVPGAAIESGFLLRLHEETAGNPFFVIETLKLLVESGTLRPEGDGWVLADPAERVHIPGRVHDVVARRLDRVSQADREVLEIASVEGLVFHSGALAACLGLPRIKVLGTLQRAEKEHRLIHAEEDQYSFDHPLIREILYEAIIPELRREYHRLIGEYLASRRKGRAGEEAAIAYQLLEAGEEEAALPFLVDAGERARHLFANAEAIALMNRAEGILFRLLDAPRGRGAPGPPDAERVRIAMRLHKGRGRLHQRLGDHERAMSDYLAMHRTAEAAGLADRQAHALTLMSELYHAMGEYDQAFDSARRAHDLAEISGDKRSLSNALRAMGAIHFYRAEYDKALVVHNRSI